MKPISRKELIELIKHKINISNGQVAAYDIVIEVATNYQLDIDSVAKVVKSDPEIKAAITKSAVEYKMITVPNEQL